MDDYLKEVTTVTDAILNGHQITIQEAASLLQASDADSILLCALANKIREFYTGNHVDLCSVINAKSGNCSEDCAFCAQSAHHKTNIACHTLLDEEQIVQTAIKRENAGAKHCDIATSGLGYKGDEEDFKTILRAFRRMKKETNLTLCACLGTLTKKAAQLLAECGVERYNHNLETAKSFYGNIVTTHTYEERIQTIQYAKNVGMEVCSGMIIGMGESPEQRLEHAFLLRELSVDSIPINILNPVHGTKLQDMNSLPTLEILKTFAIMRFILPDKIIRYAGGREKNLKSLQPLGIISGLNGMLIGNYLTTTGQGIEEDLEMLTSLNLSY